MAPGKGGLLLSHEHVQSAAHASAGRLQVILVLTASYMVVEVVGGLLTGSLALIADAGHMLADVFGVCMALGAIWFGARPATSEKTYGYYRLEILAALANGLLLLAVAVYILWEALSRIGNEPDILGAEMLAVAFVGLLVNLMAAALLFEGQGTSLNLRAAFLEVVSDLLGSVAVIIAGLVILATGFKTADLIASVLIGLFIVPRTWKLIGDALHVLLEGSPRHVNLDHVKSHILGAGGVIDVHDLHVWSLTSGVDVMSAHVVVQPEVEAADLLDELRACLADHFDIDHSTFQIEHADRGHLEHAHP
jgi:cation diffusion facilitator family transporter